MPAHFKTVLLPVPFKGGHAVDLRAPLEKWIKDNYGVHSERLLAWYRLVCPLFLPWITAIWATEPPVRAEPRRRSPLLRQPREREPVPSRRCPKLQR